MSAAPMSHGRCVQRVCCPSWSCTPHVASCPSVDGWARRSPLEGVTFAAAAALGAFPLTAKLSVEVEVALEADRERRRS